MKKLTLAVALLMAVGSFSATYATVVNENVIVLKEEGKDKKKKKKKKSCTKAKSCCKKGEKKSCHGEKSEEMQ